VRGLEYYNRPGLRGRTHPRNQGLKRAVRPLRLGRRRRRYDGLVSRFRGEPVPATDFPSACPRLQAALTMLGKLDTKPAFGPVVVHGVRRRNR
jgi:histidyl-tRNA synthetase